MEVQTKPILYSFCRSSASWRVRIALKLKGIDYEYKAVNTRAQEQFEDEYSKLNPMNRVPALFIDGKTIAESVAIVEYLEETRKDSRQLLPADPYLRAKVRQLVEIINSGIQPL